MFKGILIDKDDSGYRANLQEIDDEQLPAGDVTVRVAYSTLNFKDGLAITGSSPVVRKFPMVPGIDLAGVIDSVGSHTLANACASTRAEGTVAACGLAQGMDFPASVAPFILRGVMLAGINSVTQPKARRIEAWNRLAKDLDFALLPLISHEIGLGEALEAAPKLLAGQLRGRVVVDVNR
ncbi:alcohol dehydrogenase catalytic domain-containing protein [Pseudomonas sp. IAC-BECa141]|uniref:alcohol dehydrogenase catalytic domain-containing protein n=1 Tax=Pseudomonas sp. IAC-BECa141 TaxID=2793103 RepID=UPI001D0637CA|nr:alcohol dehydrogenase catalytic domain-containing protein [Pseudomonas sp. IAC-BECa141]UDI90428.1 hypothetical protein I5961_14650 [Pseudomonas sp. IAC-BECa141]